MENVPEVIGSNNIRHFKKWEQRLREFGYSNYVEILNAKDYGIPQNRRRCFMVSILGDYAYDFPCKMKLKYKLKDLLEKEVDEQFYLSEKMVDFFTYNSEKQSLSGNGLECKTVAADESQVAKTITTRNGSRMDDNFIDETIERERTELKIKNATNLGYLCAEQGDGIDISKRMQFHRGTVQKESCQTLTCQGGSSVGVVVKKNE